MTPDERQAIEHGLNGLIGGAVQIGVALFAVYYFGRKALVWAVNLLPPGAFDYVTTLRDRVLSPQSTGNHSSQAQEPARNSPVPAPREPVPTDRELPITLDDLLTELALCQYVDRDGEVKQFSATRLADFIGGRKSDTLETIRRLRGEPDPEPADGLRVRDANGERVIAR